VLLTDEWIEDEHEKEARKLPMQHAGIRVVLQSDLCCGPDS
jgi:hypothetical protein